MLADEVPHRLQFVAGDAKGTGDLAELVGTELVEIRVDDSSGVVRNRVTGMLEVVDLEEEAFAKVASPCADRSDVLDDLQYRLDRLFLETEDGSHLLNRHGEEPALVQ